MPKKNEDLLNSDEIDALLNASLESTSSQAEPRAEPKSVSAKPAGGEPGSGGSITQEEIEELLKHREGGAKQASATPPPREPLQRLTPDQLIEQAEADLAAALAGNGGKRGGIPAEFGAPTPFELRELGANHESAERVTGLNALQDVELDLRIELGRTELSIEDVVKLRDGSVVALDKLAGDPVDILVNGRLIARGEVLVLNENFCVRVAEILTPES